MMMSLSAAVRRMVVMKQRSNSAHLLPMQCSALALSLPQSGLVSGRVVSFGAVAGAGLLVPVQQGAELVDLIEAVEDGLAGEIVELFAAEIILPALHVADLEAGSARRRTVAEERVLEERHVFEEELLLQVLGAGGDDDALAALDDGQQVGEGFAGAGSGLDDEVALFVDGLFDGAGHGELSLAEFVGGMALREHASGAEKLVEREP